jgi:hypothetical protein
MVSHCACSVIRNNGVTGSSPVSGAPFAWANPQRNHRVTTAPYRAANRCSTSLAAHGCVHCITKPWEGSTDDQVDFSGSLGFSRDRRIGAVLRDGIEPEQSSGAGIHDELQHLCAAAPAD